MTCYKHPDSSAVAFCRSCGRPLCTVCQRPEEGTVYCEEHAPSIASGYAAPPSGTAAGGPNPYTAPVAPVAALPPGALQTSPGLAFLLGLIPGVGAIYNGQYVKGLVHAVIFGVLVSIANAGDESGGLGAIGPICAMAFFSYMPFEAYHTARKRQLGLPVDEWSSLMAQNRVSTHLPIGPILLILIGFVFLLQSLHILNLRLIGRFWPVVLIVIGAMMLYARLRRPAPVLPPMPVVPVGPAAAVQSPFVETTRE